jgi:hypothetical protein
MKPEVRSQKQLAETAMSEHEALLSGTAECTCT